MLERKFENIVNLEEDWEVLSSDNEFHKITHIGKTVPYEIWNVRTIHHTLSCADNHILFDKDNSEIFVKDLSVGTLIQTSDGLEPVLCVYKTNKLDNMYDVQVDSSEHSYLTNGIKSHNTTVTTCFLLWYILFHDDKKCAILANKAMQAKEILARIQLGYIHLPKWLQVGVKSWGKNSIELENGSMLLAAATSSDSVRGFSFSCVFIDECAFIPKNIWEKFYTSTMPTISSGKESKLILVSTPNGENHYYDFWTKAVDGKSNMVPYEVNWWDVPGRDEEWRKEILKTMSEDQFNVEYGNSFDSGTNTLIAPYIFARLSKNILSPLQSTSTLKIYETPAKNHKYILTVDCAQGTGLDYSTISVIDITTNPYKQVAVFKDNTISHLSFPQIIMQLGMKYNMAEVLIESNDIGNTILHILNYDIEYENIVKTFSGVMGKPILGQKTTIRTKSVGCSRIKDMLESGMLIILDSDTLTEFRHFSLSGQSYAADTGYHDDLVMGLVNFAYYASTPQFRMKYDENFTDEYRKEYDEKIMETLAPLPIFSSNMRDVDAADISWLRD